MSEVVTPNKRCHNCRRQRLRCDRSYPHCNKCVLAGKECLGYGQLFRWTGSIASRGKLAGKTSSADTNYCRTPTLKLGSASASSSRASTPQTESPASSFDELKPADDGEWQMVPWTETLDDCPPQPWVLADPLVQDLSHDYRYYMTYFTTRFCKDLVSYDVPDRNPFRGLIPLTMKNPLLQHIIVAASAAHMSNLMRPSLPTLQQTDSQIIRFASNEASSRALRDALIAKQEALKLMHNAVQNIDTVGVDVVLAASLFFINVELIESGKHGWKAHLEGAGKIMSLLGPAEGASRDLRDYMLSDCFCYFVLASAFTHSTSNLQTYFESSQIPLILERATANSYMCCPPQILETLYAAAQLSNVKVEDEDSCNQVAAAGLELLKKAQNIDIRAWAIDALNVSYLQGIPLASRMNAGSAHRLAACLYIVQAIEPVSDIIDSKVVQELNEALYDQLERIPLDDPNFKSTSWPTFIVGAGATDPKRRTWIMDRLQKLVKVCPWGFFYTAMETLQVIWSVHCPDELRTWVQTLKDPRLNFLMV